MAYFPFMVDISGKKCLVAGGGRIAFHKVRILLEFGVQIRVVAEEICGELAALQTPLLEFCERRFLKTDIRGMDFVVAATDREDLNHSFRTVREEQIPVNASGSEGGLRFYFSRNHTEGGCAGGSFHRGKQSGIRILSESTAPGTDPGILWQDGGYAWNISGGNQRACTESKGTEGIVLPSALLWS